MKKKILIFHIGYPKTGTWHLRYRVMKNKNINYLGKFHNKKNPVKDYIKKEINNILYQKNENVFLKSIKKIKKNNIYSNKVIHFYSEEKILGLNKKKIKRNIILRRLKTLIKNLGFSDYKILITLRNPTDLLLSSICQNNHYFKYLKKINCENLCNDKTLIEYLNLKKLKKDLILFFPKNKLIFINFKDIFDNNSNMLDKVFGSRFGKGKKINKSIKLNIANYTIIICKIQLKTKLRVFLRHLDIKRLLGDIYFTLKNIIIIFNKKEIRKLKLAYGK